MKKQTEIENKIMDLYKKVSELREQKARFETEEIVSSFEEGKYYRLSYNCESYYFKYTKENLRVQDMEGTVGYDGKNKIIIQHGLKFFATRACYYAGIFHTVYISISDFEVMNIREITEEEYKEECNQVIKYLEQEKSEIE